jgi:hypothetical protein
MKAVRIPEMEYTTIFPKAICACEPTLHTSGGLFILINKTIEIKY